MPLADEVFVFSTLLDSLAPAHSMVNSKLEVFGNCKGLFVSVLPDFCLIAGITVNNTAGVPETS